VYHFISVGLRIIAATTFFWPLTIPLAALAYRIRLGQRPMPLEPGPFWLRSTFASLGLALLTVIGLALWLVLVVFFELPPGPIEVVLFLVYIPAAVCYLFWMYALDDMLEALGIFLIYVLLPGLPLLLIAWLTGLWKLAWKTS
jgi:hypothetical protein